MMMMSGASRRFRLRSNLGCREAMSLEAARKTAMKARQSRSRRVREATRRILRLMHRTHPRAMLKVMQQAEMMPSRHRRPVKVTMVGASVAVVVGGVVAAKRAMRLMVRLQRRHPCRPHRKNLLLLMHVLMYVLMHGV